MNVEEKALALANDPTEFFENDINQMGTIDREEMEQLHLAGIQTRFNDLRNKVPVLKKLADKQGIDEIKTLNDIVPLLFEHTMYKSYPSTFLEKGQFPQLTKWLDKLTSYDLSDLDVSHCTSIDEWIAYMETASPLRISNSSGTTGTMSFLPHSAEEWEMQGKTQDMVLAQRFGADTQLFSEPFEMIYPFFRSGYTASMRTNDVRVKYLLDGDEERLHCAFPTHMSSDVLYLAARIRAAQAKGALDRLKIGDGMRARYEEAAKLDADMPERRQQFFDEMFERFKGKRIWTGGSWSLLHPMAVAGLEKGQENMFSPDSHVIGGGGAKGMTPPDNWEADVARFTGVERIEMTYAMSEVFAWHRVCSHGRMHLAPWAIPFVLDPDTSEILPRKGVVTGRAAFFGLIARTHWGGFITGDEITIDWDSQCGCGQTTYHIDQKIQRFTEKTGEDDKISCAATPDAHKEAMSFLSNLSQ